MTPVEHAPPWVARLCDAALQLGDRAGAVVHGEVALGLLSEAIAHHESGKTIDTSLVADCVIRLARNQLTIANQADRAVAREGELRFVLRLGIADPGACAGEPVGLRAKLVFAGFPGRRARQSRRKASNSAGPRYP